MDDIEWMTNVSSQDSARLIFIWECVYVCVCVCVLNKIYKDLLKYIVLWKSNY